MSIIFINGKYTGEPLVISCYDRGFTLGDGLFETLKFKQGQLQFFDEHMQRLRTSALFFKIPLHYSDDELASICLELINVNKLLDDVVAIRVTLTRGIAKRGLAPIVNPSPTVLVTAKAYVGSDDPVALMVSDFSRYSKAISSHHKTLNYAENILARQQAVEQGYQDAILLNEHQQVTSATAANIFWISHGVVCTPDLSCGVLPGIVRQKILAFCERERIPTEVTCFEVSSLLKADDIFICNSLIGVSPVMLLSHINSTVPSEILTCIIDYFSIYV